jgi:hypothetical protein
MGRGLVGTIPSYIGQLEYLQVFSVTSNPLLEGTIPTEISLLSSLSILNVSYNALGGTIPMLGPHELSYLHLGKQSFAWRSTGLMDFNKYQFFVSV